jgi:hypothetical protein
MAHAPVSLPSRRTDPAVAVRLDRLAEAVGRLDPATRALLDLSVRRGVRDDAMAPILHTDPFHLAWRRARALDRLASDVGEAGRPAPLGEVRMALEALPREAWGLPGAGPPALPPPREGRVAEEPAGAAEPDVASEPARAAARDASRDPAPTADPDGSGPAAHGSTGTELVPTAVAALDTPAPAGRLDRLDAFAAESPTLRLALRLLGRAVAAKAVRVVVWRRRGAR